MKRGLSLRRMLISGLLLSVGVWAADQLWGRGVPQAASATPSPATVTTSAGPARVGGSADVGGVLPLATRLLPKPYASVAERLAGVPRDPFAPSPYLDALVSLAHPPVAVEPPPPAPQVEDGAAAFRAVYQLEGVVIGPRPLAVVNGRVLGVGAELDGWQLVRVEREQVAFRRAGEVDELVLVVPRPGAGDTAPAGDR